MLRFFLIRREKNQLNCYFGRGGDEEGLGLRIGDFGFGKEDVGGGMRRSGTGEVRPRDLLE